jgi:hypothetical protein
MQRGSQSDTDFSLGSMQELRGGGREEGNDRMVNIVNCFFIKEKVAEMVF